MLLAGAISQFDDNRLLRKAKNLPPIFGLLGDLISDFMKQSEGESWDPIRSIQSAFTYAYHHISISKFAIEMDDAAIADTVELPSNLFLSPLWGSKDGANMTHAISWEVFKAHCEHHENAHMSFWREWYQGFLDGKPLDWELQKEIALIPDAEWEKGPQWIAEKIEEIRKKYVRKPLDQEQVKEQAKRLIAQPETTALVTISVADQIDEAIELYFAEAKVNQLPEALEPLHHLPPLLRRIAKSSQTDEKIAELHAEIIELVATVNALNNELRAKGGSLGGKAVETIVLTTVALGTTAFWGSVVAGISHVTGIVDVGGLIERLSTAAPQIPQTLDIPPAPRPPLIEL